MNYSDFVPSADSFEIINGVNQTRGVVAGVDPRQKGTKKERTYWIGQYLTESDGSVNYDTYFLYENLNTHWAASEPKNRWNDITCQDMRIADSVYASLTPKQQYNVDWVRGLALHVGCILFFCIDEPDWACALFSGENQIEFDDYEIAKIDINLDPSPLNDYDPVNIIDITPFDVTEYIVKDILIK